MELITDIFLAAGAIGAGFYCFVLGKRLNKFNDLKDGIGGAVAVLSAQVDDLTKTLATAQTSAGDSAEELTSLATRAEDISRQLELQMASLHDLDLPRESQPTAVNSAALSTSAPVQPMFVRSNARKGVI